MKPGYFFRTPFFLPWLFPDLTWRIRTVSKDLFLTFDDGPVMGPTDFVLEQLKNANAKATFFCIGDNIRSNAAVFQRVTGQGHGVGNHTYHHLSGWKTPRDNYLSDVRMCGDEIQLHGQQPAGPDNLFRPPYGRIARNQIGALKAYNIVMWDVLTHDYAKNLAAEQCLRGSVAAARPGSIVVFHDSFKAEKNLNYVLPRFLDHFGGLGYSFKSLP